MASKKSKDNSLVQSLEVKEEYKKPNFLISAKYKSTLMENQIQAYSLSHIDHFVIDEKTHALVDVMKAAELRKVLGGNSGSFYKQLAMTADLMTSRNIGFVDPETKSFDFMSIVIKSRYERGKFYLYYNPYLTEYIKDIKNKFTPLSLKVMMSFKDVYSFRLYELIKSQCYFVNQVKDETNRFRFRMSLAELKLDLGIVNVDKNDTALVRELKGKKHPNFDKAIELSNEKKMEKWSDFERYALRPAIKEINTIKSGMHISYDTVRGGRGGKITAIIFTVDMLIEEEQALLNDIKILTDEEKEDFLDDMRDVIEEKIKTKDLRKIAEAANYNLLLIEEKYALSKTQNIDNLVGWLLTSIKEDYKKPISSLKKSKNNWNFEESNTIYDEELLFDN